MSYTFFLIVFGVSFLVFGILGMISTYLKLSYKVQRISMYITVISAIEFFLLLLWNWQESLISFLQFFNVIG